MHVLITDTLQKAAKFICHKCGNKEKILLIFSIKKSILNTIMITVLHWEGDRLFLPLFLNGQSTTKFVLNIFL